MVGIVPNVIGVECSSEKLSFRPKERFERSGLKGQLLLEDKLGRHHPSPYKHDDVIGQQTEVGGPTQPPSTPDNTSMLNELIVRLLSRLDSVPPSGVRPGTLGSPITVMLHLCSGT
ncbi:hypothetical protein H5410_046946 [Solanum commersonii]|uniref:Uncharacterized protein n=1 Tax=Solanum commersonii TaxID=4109 RepID=A0A9J5XHU0_SOLCO|nr:hypothetical protein H5410_046946 [Solanum commersonii]